MKNGIYGIYADGITSLFIQLMIAYSRLLGFMYKIPGETL